MHWSFRATLHGDKQPLCQRVVVEGGPCRRVKGSCSFFFPSVGMNRKQIGHSGRKV